MPKARKTAEPKPRGPGEKRMIIREDSPDARARLLRTSRETLKTLKAEFDAAHVKGMAALRSGDYAALGKAIDAERRLIDKQRSLLAPRKRET
jgi:hypothetical protein